MRLPWGSDPEDAGLLQFLLEKLKEVNPSCSALNPLVSEYQRKTGKYSLTSNYFVKRLHVLNESARKSLIDRELQVKVLFLLSVCVHKKLLEKLRMDAYIELDDDNRITKYRANDGNLNLEGDHMKSRKSRGGEEERERRRILRSRELESTAPQVPNHPPQQLPRVNIPQNIVYWYPTNFYYPLVNPHPGYQFLPRQLPNLRIQAPGNQLLQVPTMNPRIQEVREGKQEVGAPEAPGSSRRHTNNGSIDPVPKTPGSTKRAAPEVPNSSKRTRTDVVKTEDSAPDDSARITSKDSNPKIQQLRQPKLEAPEEPPPAPVDPRAQTTQKAPNLRMGSAQGAPEPTGPPARSNSEPNNAPRTPGAPAPTPEPSRPQSGPADIQHLRQPKLESPMDPPAQIPQEVPNLRAPGPPGPPTATQFVPNNAPEPPAPAPESSRSFHGPADAYTPQIKFLETIQSLVHTLNMPNLSLLQTRISRKIRESSSTNSWIPNDEISLALELLVAKLTNHSVPILPGTVESISLKEFLCYLKAAILNSKLEGLEGLMEKINTRIREPTLKEKSIPMVRVTGLLQTTLNNAGV